MKSRRAKTTRDPDATLAALLDAAEGEFNAHGFGGTDSNRIARRAGYAPQTFYRHFADKTAIFLAVYERWWKSESGALGELMRVRRPDLAKVADAMIAFHVKWKGFRRSLRHLATEDARVRAARSTARKAQIEAVRPFVAKAGDGEILAALLIFERLCDAVAEGEYGDAGLPKSAGRAAVLAAIRDFLGSTIS
ncbi:MAG TPA: helix-turn-helix domain-containing protein [Rhizomicrobium sp.]|jgi:AcrR family transcriptional regulator